MSDVPVADEVERIASRVVRECGLELVDFKIHRSGGIRLVRLDIDRAGAVGVGLDDCQRVSRTLSAVLDEADLIQSRYHLEVSSPGADRPIRTADDIRRNTGRRVLVLADDPRRGRCCYRGRLLGAASGGLLLETEDGQPLTVPLERVVKAQQDLAI